MNLNPTEKELLQHRLDVPDALADALEEEFSHPYVEECARVLAKALRTSADLDFSKLSACQLALLKDCIEGSTFFADAEDAVAAGTTTRSQLMHWQKAAHSLERKFAALGHKVNFPRA